MDGWKASSEGQAYDQEVYMVAIYVLIGFVEKKVPELDVTFLRETLSHQLAILVDMIGTCPFGAQEDDEVALEKR